MRALGDGELSTASVVSRVPLPYTTTRQILDRLKSQGLVASERRGARLVWSLLPDPAALQAAIASIKGGDGV